MEDDKAQFTVFTGMVAADSDRQVWLRDQSTNEKLVLRKGDRLQYAGFDAEVLDIGRDFFTFQQKNDTLKLQLGQTLRDATVIASIDPPAAEPATTEPPAADAPSEEPDEAEASEAAPQPAAPSTDQPSAPADDAEETEKPADPEQQEAS